MKKKIVLKEHLNHQKYNWPITMLSYPIVFNEAVAEGDWELRNIQGEKIPFQVSDVQKEGHLVKSLTVSFLTGLQRGECKEFYFLAGEKGIGSVDVEKLSPSFELNIDRSNSTFTLTYIDKKMVCTIPFDSIEYHVINSGCIFEDVEIICKGIHEETYVLNVRRIAGMPFWEIKERMSGIDDNDKTEMRISFEGFDFTHRYSWGRPVEKINAYLREGSRLPVVVMPFENWFPWFQSKYIGFAGEEYFAGVFIRDNLEWDDEKYPIWGSNREFGITFHYANDKVTAHFPLKNGKRFVGIAACKRGEAVGADGFAAVDGAAAVDKADVGYAAVYAEYLWRWYAHLHLDKVKDWVLDWKEEQGQYPRFFREAQEKSNKAQSGYLRGEMLDGQKMTELIDERSKSVKGYGTGPVSNREFRDWVEIIDLTADKMTKEEFDRAKAWFAFMAYVCKDENYMPTENMLAGHPNFLSDTINAPGFMPAMFPNHPEAEIFRQYFHKTVSLNLKYHIRPDVAAYESLGGRATENLACYTFAMLGPVIHVCELYKLCGHPIPLICENGAKWLNWLTNCMSAPVDGRRMKPSQGAHARRSSIPYTLYVFAQLMEEAYPELAQNTYAVFKESTFETLEFSSFEDSVWSTLVHRGDDEGKLTLKSEKFTGYGCILREAVGTPDEISVHVQQLDRGPNYRWGSFENTGNGGIHYYAAGKRYSFNAMEDTGDRNLGAEEGNCGFAVLKRHTYHNIGFRDLTEPLWDFPVIKQIKLLAGDNIKDYYKYRRASLVEKDYAVLYDAVTHMRAKGRFLWTVNALEEFPQIHQLVPGVEGVACRVSETDYTGTTAYVYKLETEEQSKSMVYDGFGNFLTLVSHRKDLTAKATEYGAVVFLPERTDYIFEDEAKVRYQDETMCFEGYSGIISVHKDGVIRGALTEGKKIGIGDMLFELEGKGAVYFEKKEGVWRGSIAAKEACRLQIGLQTLQLEKGTYTWTLEDGIKTEQLAERTYSGMNGFVRDTRSHEFGFEGFDFEDRGEILTYPE